MAEVLMGQKNDKTMYTVQTISAFLTQLPVGTHIVTTNGCFDLLHVGHLRYLQFAKAQGDVLILAINSDASVQRLKGPTRPIIPQEERAELLEALRCVDAVVLFDGDTPDDVLQVVKPHTHVKGAQYDEASLPEADLLRSLGTKMVFAPMIDGRSTTNIVNKLLANEGVQSTSTCSNTISKH
jgi:rfaE bifunctional protein nucleotidyltransferase chain/domain